MTDYRIGQPLTEGQNPLRVFSPKPGFITIAVYRPDGSEVVNVSIAGDWDDRIGGPAVAALNKRIAGWPVGPFTLDDVKASA